MIALIFISLIGSLVAHRVALYAGKAGPWLVALLPAFLFFSFLGHAGAIGTGEVIFERIDWVPSLGIGLGVRLDGFSLLFTLLITGIGTLVTLYAGAYFAEYPAKKRAMFLFFIILFMSAMLGTVLADDLIMMFVFWEMTSVTSFMLIGFEATKPEARKAALQSLLVTAGGGLSLFAGILLIGMTLGTFSLSEVALRADELVASPYLAAIIVLILGGAFTKSAQFPFHFWLPNAMAAPTPASAYLHSATMVKLGVYLLARFDSIFASVPAFGLTLVAFGSATMLIAAFLALRAIGYKGVLAQSTVASLGILVMLIGLDGYVASVATVGFILTHALYKAALFFCAGTAIHATGITRLRGLGGLARFLPFTAAAAALASLSMAGLPPFIGFISKEYLFEAQLESSMNWIPVLVAVLVNAVMVAVAGAVSLKPFFFNRERIESVKHGETLGLLVGPLILATLGTLFGIAPWLVAQSLVQPAASALYGSPIDVSFSLWHGLTPMLALSALVVALGTAIVVYWDRLHIALRRMRWPDRLLGDKGYHAVFDGVIGAANGSTRFFQNGDQRRYTLIVAIATIALIGWAYFRSGGNFAILATGGPILIAPTALLILAVAGAVAAARTQSLITAVVAVGIVGYVSALLFLMNGAPDLALTQFSVETLVVVVIMAVLVRLPTYAPSTRTAGERRIDIGVSAAFALLVFVGLATMTAEPLDMRLTEFFSQRSLTEAYGHNVVNVVIVDFRALDTLGEIAVVGFATLAVWGLLRRRRPANATLARKG
ncbi:DUF4040 domain-containing protein [Arsenicitalea aurantiaca]|uniref:DUF4040 domain-containing protein n=1 Tax=Arsenicitalea aurantiaca TaxID=1783274 RepID=A0A433X2S8_9HYPH|nr:DUF4040 domain-containing protein [Arsenicitalea aurantiaca]